MKWDHVTEWGCEGKAELSPRKSSQDHVYSGSGFWFLMCSETNSKDVWFSITKPFFLNLTSQLRHLAYLREKVNTDHFVRY